MNYYTGLFAGIPLIFGFNYPGTAKYYQNWLQETDESKNAITVPSERIEYWASQWNATDKSYAEYVNSCSYACDVLMRYNRIVFHGAAFLWNGFVYIFSAPSGTGKTTQIKLWQKLFPKETVILNGDKPILEVDKSQIIVHPSPWKGKEGMGRDDLSAPLGGIILLKQDKSNTIEKLLKGEAARNLFCRFYSTYTTETEVITAGNMLEQILNTVPVYILKNKGDCKSAFITHDYLLSELK